jgi:pyridoxamine 5'-phosphate oxidase
MPRISHSLANPPNHHACEGEHDSLSYSMDRTLSESDLSPHPIVQFNRWYADAVHSGLPHPEVMTLATVSPDGKPAARIVLLKHVDSGGFFFFSNYGSLKSRSILLNPAVALVFHWDILERQVRVEGRAEKVTEEVSNSYFRTRDRQSQIGAWASNQSTEIPDRNSLETRCLEFEKRFAGGEVPRPDYWGGFRIVPDRVEFWQGRAGRLHDRLVYAKTDTTPWRISRLAP